MAIIIGTMIEHSRWNQSWLTWLPDQHQRHLNKRDTFPPN